MLFSGVNSIHKLWHCLIINVHFVRYLSNHNLTNKSYSKIKELKLRVNPKFGSLNVKGNINYIIRPTSTEEYPDADTGFISLYGPLGTLCNHVDARLTGISEEELQVDGHGTTDSLCLITVPLKYDVSVKIEGKAGVCIEHMESEKVQVSTQEGSVQANSLKTHSFDVTTQSGSITSENFLKGNICIKAKKTNVTAKKLQGLELNVVAGDLTMDLKACYMSSGKIAAKRGFLTFSNFHGCTDLALEEGKVQINTFHGQLNSHIGEGDVSINVNGLTGNSELVLGQGNLKISLVQPFKHNLLLTAPALSISNEAKSTGRLDNQTFTIQQKDSQSHVFKASVQDGTASLSMTDWFSSLGIKTR